MKSFATVAVTLILYINVVSLFNVTMLTEANSLNVYGEALQSCSKPGVSSALYLHVCYYIYNLCVNDDEYDGCKCLFPFIIVNHRSYLIVFHFYVNIPALHNNNNDMNGITMMTKGCNGRYGTRWNVYRRHE